ncbi:DUF881 domain-containing protein [Quadrisphaera sp. DSM 44207]|uniref:DUF881 domain-containing protein n=1 Tax=Quadrisphaera sp. DSM 44207 TaxID=1881057 RepID=UPI00088CA91E|nr:DUF881 domain-containing protein [Quadrisphaera sp. DSM 44207]SDQ39242.1 Uncharacterized conserved protein YlxW, UPF0749 family [Quadrisphaera sp. DSM 44207]
MSEHEQRPPAPQVRQQEQVRRGGGRHPSAAGRARLRAALLPRPTRAQLFTGLLCLLLGLALAVQVRSNTGEDLTSLRQSELIGLLDDAGDRGDRLAREVRELERTRDELVSSSDQSAAARELAQERLEQLSILAGTAGATGPGIRLTVAGPEVDAAVLLGAVQELRDAGAEAIQVGDVRVVASTAFVDAADGSVLVDGQELDSPFVFLAIGSAQTLASAMDFPGGVIPTVTSEGGTAAVEELEVVEVSALRAPSEPQYARPADPPSSS